jgi:hypothetical protein
MNRAFQGTPHDLEPAGTGSHWSNLMIALFTTERQRESRPAVHFRKSA